MELDHVALTSGDIAQSVQWYVQHFSAQVEYQDESWAMLRVGQEKLALVSPRQHPPHVAFAVDEARLEAEAKSHGVAITPHRDGSRGIYLHDPSGNAVELICYKRQ